MTSRVQTVNFIQGKQLTSQHHILCNVSRGEHIQRQNGGPVTRSWRVCFKTASTPTALGWLWWFACHLLRLIGRKCLMCWRLWLPQLPVSGGNQVFSEIFGISEEICRFWSGATLTFHPASTHRINRPLACDRAGCKQQKPVTRLQAAACYGFFISSPRQRPQARCFYVALSHL